MKSTQIILVAVMSGLLSFNAAAHSLWLEGDTSTSKLYFGEYDENLRETSPGRLDSIIAPIATVIDATGAERSVNASRSGNNFDIPGGTAVLVQALKQPVREPQGGNSAPAQKRFYYARLGKGGSLPLDIQHIQQPNANLLRLSFKGTPLAKTEIVLTAPSGWQKHLRTDENGEAGFSPPEPGLYVAEARHTLDNPGEFEGKAYAIEIHIVTLSLYK